MNLNPSRGDWLFPIEEAPVTASVTHPHIGHRVSSACRMANIAIKLGRELKWDPPAEQFTGDAEALALVSPRCDPW